MDVIGEGAIGTPAIPTPEQSIEEMVAAEMGTESIPAESAESAEDTPVEAPAVEAPAEEATPTQEAPAADDEATAPEKTPEKTPAEQVKSLMESVNGEAMKLNPDDLPEELRPWLKSMQADYTRKTQKVATERNEVSEKSEELKALEQQLDELRTTLQQPQQPQQAASPPVDEVAQAIEASVVKDHGPLLSFDDMVASQDPKTMQTYIAQQSALAARHAAYEMAQQLAPQVQGVKQQVESERAAKAQHEADTYYAAHPDLKPFDAEIGALLQVQDPATGQWKYTLEQAGELVAAHNKIDSERTSAMAVGLEMGRTQALQVKDNKDAFNVPSADTGGKPPVVLPANASWDDVAEAGLIEAGIDLGPK